MNTFEALLNEHLGAVTRFVNCRINNRADADDVLQETLLAAHRAFGTLRDHALFKAWLIRIAKNKCTDYYRRKRDATLSLDELTTPLFFYDRCGMYTEDAVSDALAMLNENSKQILYLYYFKEYSLEEIARRLSLPIGTVKSRLHNARQQFKELYPYTPQQKGAFALKDLPKYLPHYTITPSAKPPFDVHYEELPGLCIIPRLHEESVWGSYAAPSGKLIDYCHTKVVGGAVIHDIEGVEITTVQHRFDELGRERIEERQFIAQLTDTHCRYLAESHIENGVKKIFTFLDSDVFALNWGYGEDNCGTETHLTAKGQVTREGDRVTTSTPNEVVDVVGRYEVTIGDKTYDTVCVMDVGHFGGRVAVEQYIDQNGRTVLWRRFNRDDWAIKRYGKPWSEQLPDNDRLTINGTTYVHWYDCITAYIL